MASKVYVDRILVHWGEELLWDDSHRSVQRKARFSNPLRPGNAASSGSGPTDTPATAAIAAKVRSHVAAIVRQAPQVMVKITGGGADMRRIGSHIDYIARGGRYKKKGEDELEIETDDGQTVQGEDARKRIKELFAYSGTPNDHADARVSAVAFTSVCSYGAPGNDAATDQARKRQQSIRYWHQRPLQVVPSAPIPCASRGYGQDALECWAVD